ncbi:hypothetical protein OIU79_026791 [Salix purpurea]|uniref:BZIP domain-containing protein n=1 Tax=Salix purpurea TaxID=77065 RepID=A0A9Q0VSZ9_SALPP|nr:hypothetical protein OIU79_026791 [Salix purpurea]
MFPLPPSREDELKASDFTALSLSSDIQASHQSYIPSQAANKESGLARTCSRCKELIIPTEPVSCVSLGGDYSHKQPAPTAAVSGFVKTSEKRVFDGASPYHHQFVQGVRGGNANKESDDRRYVNDPNRACLYQQYGRGISCENDGKMNTHPRARKAPGKSSFSDKIQHRMIKNRESAARSRARKQALEAQQQVENTELKKENELLKRVVRFLLAILRTKRMKLPALSRSFSAPL